jgi:DNA primase
MSRRTSSGTVRKGWDVLTSGSPVPGNIPAALAELGIVLAREDHGEFYALCPGHRERTGKPDHHPSWSVNEETGAHYCFACGFKGSFVSLVAYVLGLHTDEAVGWVRARGSIERARAVLERRTEPTPLAVDTSKVVSEASLALCVPPPASALARRRLSPESAEHHGVLWDARRDCWVIPIRDPDGGRLLGWQEKNERYFRNRPRQVKKARTLFGADVFEPGSTAILVESPLDVLRLRTAGFPGGLSSYGVGVSQEQMRLIMDRTDTLIVALDNDRDGTKMCEEIRRGWGRRGLHLRYFNYTGTSAKDPGDMTDAEIGRAVDSAYSSVLARFR